MTVLFLLVFLFRDFLCTSAALFLVGLLVGLLFVAGRRPFFFFFFLSHPRPSASFL